MSQYLSVKLDERGQSLPLIDAPRSAPLCGGSSLVICVFPFVLALDLGGCHPCLRGLGMGGGLLVPHCLVRSLHAHRTPPRIRQHGHQLGGVSLPRRDLHHRAASTVQPPAQGHCYFSPSPERENE